MYIAYVCVRVRVCVLCVNLGGRTHSEEHILIDENSGVR